MINSKFVERHNIPRIAIEPRDLLGVGQSNDQIKEIVRLDIDLDGHKNKGVYMYVLNETLSYDMMLGLPWMQENDVRLEAKGKRMYIRKTQVRVRQEPKETTLDCYSISAAAYDLWMNKAKKEKNKGAVQCFAASMADIEKALAPKKVVNLESLPEQYRDFARLFSPKEADKLPPVRGPGIDHAIELEKTEDGKTPEAPWGPLYNMSRDELLVLRKTLTDLLDKGFIRVSNSPAASPVLFVRKPGGGLRFCVDYRALNKITRKDRYPLPLIHETLNNISKAKWFTKLDVIAAFHKLRIQEGDEWLTAFRTRYGLFEWLVTPFGMAGAPSTFQRYINWVLREFLDEFVSAYLDDILIYTNGSLKEHRRHVRSVLAKLQEAGLYIDIGKCEFETQSTKYLGFIIEAGKGIRMDPEKIKAIREWEAPKSVKGVRSFLGFANFYRRFIKDFSILAMPLVKLTAKGQEFRWTSEAEDAFVRMKTIFCTEPTLAQFDPDRTTLVETDASGWCTGGVLFQFGDDGLLRPCAYFSKKNLPAECNYEIHDKEMLAIVRCLEEWDSELRSVQDFEIITDHKNLEYFLTVRKLSERHVRWSLFLQRYNFKIKYRSGKENERADALSRREQDLPEDASDERVQPRTFQLLSSDQYEGEPVEVAVMCSVKESLSVMPAEVLSENPEALLETYEEESSPPRTELEELWKSSQDNDILWNRMKDVVAQGVRKFPPDVEIKVSVSECTVENGILCFRGRKWVPENEELRTKIMQTAHDSPLTGHPGRKGTLAILMRDFFWPNMGTDVRRFVRNCNACGRNKPWHERKQGLLRPLPIPDRTWQELSVDFVVELPESEGCTNLMVITDRLGKGLILEPMAKIGAEEVAWTFIRTVFRRHGLPYAIVSDRGTQFVGQVWSTICKHLKIVRRLSTAYHPQTDGATEKANSTVEAYIRAFASYDQKNWARLIPVAEYALNGREATSTGVSPFFLGHGYNASPFDLSGEVRTTATETSRSPIVRGEAIVHKIQQAQEWAQMSMAAAQQDQETQANRNRQVAPLFKVGDKVWLNLENIRTTRPAKKLDWKNAKYTITEIIGTHSVRLNVGKEVHDVFHVDRVKLAATDPFPSQVLDDEQPPAILVDNEEEYEVEDIVREEWRRRGRGKRLWYEVKWAKYAETSWEPADGLEETVALTRWIDRTKDLRDMDNALPPGFRWTSEEGGG